MPFLVFGICATLGFYVAKALDQRDVPGPEWTIDSALTISTQELVEDAVQPQDRDDLVLWTRLLESSAASGQYEECLKLVRNLTADFSSTVESWISIAAFNDAAGDEDMALIALCRALVLRPLDFELRSNVSERMSKIFAARGDPGDVRTLQRILRRAAPEEREDSLVKTLHDLCNRRSLLDQMMERGHLPERPHDVAEMARIFLFRGNSSRALELFDQAFHSAPELNLLELGHRRRNIDAIIDLIGARLDGIGNPDELVQLCRKLKTQITDELAALKQNPSTRLNRDLVVARWRSQVLMLRQDKASQADDMVHSLLKLLDTNS